MSLSQRKSESVHPPRLNVIGKTSWEFFCGNIYSISLKRKPKNSKIVILPIHKYYLEHFQDFCQHEVHGTSNHRYLLWLWFSFRICLCMSYVKKIKDITFQTNINSSDCSSENAEGCCCASDRCNYKKQPFIASGGTTVIPMASGDTTVSPIATKSPKTIKIPTIDVDTHEREKSNVITLICSDGALCTGSVGNIVVTKNEDDNTGVVDVLTSIKNSQNSNNTTSHWFSNKSVIFLIFYITILTPLLNVFKASFCLKLLAFFEKSEK